MELKELIRHKKAKGILLKMLNNPAYMIMAKDCGFDFVFFDCEHGILSYEELHDTMIFGNTIGIPSIVRVAELTRRDISKTLDLGASGIMVPMIETKEQAESLVNWSKYPPIGNRSYSGGANTFYAPSGNHEKNMNILNNRTLTIVQIETIKGIQNIEEILSVKGIDAAIIGPCDLAISLGNPDDVMTNEELKAIQKVAETCKEHKKAFGIIGGMKILKYFKNDINLLLSAIDTNLVRESMKKAVDQYEELE